MLTAVLAASCGVGAVREPDVRDARWAAGRWPGTTVANLQRGRDLFSSRCSTCHALPSPEGKSPEEWGPAVDEMGSRAELSAGDRLDLLRYLSASSERSRSGT